MKKLPILLLFALFLGNAATAQRAIIYKNFANYVYNNRSDLTFGFQMRDGNFLTVGIENWHFHRTLFTHNDNFTELKVTSFGRRFNMGMLHFYNKNKERKWHFYDHFFAQFGYQFHDVTVLGQGFSGNGTPSTIVLSTSVERMRCAGFGLENGFVRDCKKLYFGPAITNGYVIYFNRSNFLFTLGRDGFNKGMYLWLPVVRFVVGYRI